jgi:hypothetical protein
MQWDFYWGLWHVSFLEQDCRTPLPLKLKFLDPEKIRRSETWPGMTLPSERVSLNRVVLGMIPW